MSTSLWPWRFVSIRVSKGQVVEHTATSGQNFLSRSSSSAGGSLQVMILACLLRHSRDLSGEKTRPGRSAARLLRFLRMLTLMTTNFYDKKKTIHELTNFGAYLLTSLKSSA